MQSVTESENGEVGYPLDNGSSYVYGRVLLSEGGGKILYISTSLGAVGSTVTILRTQLIWVTVASVLLCLPRSLRFSLPGVFLAR